MQATVVATRASRRLLLAAALVAFVIVLALVLGLVARTPNADADRVALASIAQGVSLARIGERAVVFVRDGDDVRTFVGRAGPEDALVWCPDAKVLATAIRGSTYDLDGRRVGGPGPAQLPEYTTRVEGDRVRVSVGHRFDVSPLAWTDALEDQWISARAGVCPHR